MVGVGVVAEVGVGVVVVVVVGDKSAHVYVAELAMGNFLVALEGVVRMMPWEFRKNEVLIDTWRQQGSEIALASWYAPRNVALAFWAALVRGCEGPKHWARLSDHRRFMAPSGPGWVHCAVVHRGALPHEHVESAYRLYAVEDWQIRAQQISPVPLKLAWLTEELLHSCAESPVSLVPGFGKPVWSISCSEQAWLAFAQARLKEG